MKFPILSLALCLALAGCGDGNPFDETANGGGTDTDTDGGETGVVIPEALAGDLESFTYDPTAQTLIVRGVSLEDGPFEAKYRRRAALDRAGYQAYTQQDGSLDRHSTAYVKQINGTRAAVVVTGSQFKEIFAGGAYGNTTYSAPVAPGTDRAGGLVTYAGAYVGLLNGPGSSEDLLPVKPGTNPDFLSVQAAEITGRAVVTGSFSDGAIDGAVSRRRIVDGNIPLDSIELGKGKIAANGSFDGIVNRDRKPVGTYAGIFGGAGATEVAGILRAENHIDGIDDEIEFGVFVLGKCGGPKEDPVCDQPRR